MRVVGPAPHAWAGRGPYAGVHDSSSPKTPYCPVILPVTPGPRPCGQGSGGQGAAPRPVIQTTAAKPAAAATFNAGEQLTVSPRSIVVLRGPLPADSGPA